MSKAAIKDREHKCRWSDPIQDIANMEYEPGQWYKKWWKDCKICHIRVEVKEESK